MSAVTCILKGEETDLDELREDETGRSSTDQQDLGTKGHLQLVHAVDSARSGLEQGSLLVGEVVDLVALGEVAIYQRLWQMLR